MDLKLAQGVVNELPAEIRGGISDGYHTFNEMYDHRIALFLKLCEVLDTLNDPDALPIYRIWRSKIHSDGSIFEGWFVMGIGKQQGKQITYHLPMAFWEETNFVETLDRAPEFDGHTSADVLERLKNL